jgi:hypothetical protein
MLLLCCKMSPVDLVVSVAVPAWKLVIFSNSAARHHQTLQLQLASYLLLSAAAAAAAGAKWRGSS